MPALGNLVHETSTTSGVQSPLVIARVNGKQRILEMLDRLGLPDGDNGGSNPTVFISNRDVADEWAVVQGYILNEGSPSGDNLVIASWIESSNFDTPLTWSPGIKDVIVAIDAATLAAGIDYGLITGAVNLSDDYGSVA